MTTINYMKKFESKEMDPKIAMISSATEVINFRKQNPSATSEQMMSHVSKATREYKGELAKIHAIASAGKVVSIMEKHPRVPSELLGLTVNQARQKTIKLLEKENYDDAMREFNLAIQLDPKFSSAYRVYPIGRLIKKQEVGILNKG